MLAQAGLDGKRKAPDSRVTCINAGLRPGHSMQGAKGGKAWARADSAR